ncbi:hypothetical protein I3843_05G084600 [Carya illinoinensis]|uniref:Alpha-1,3-mannosyl-glycoprotein 2-beta-N-acetylglucosaminyltransferase n=1 Tax=Carya illinoinensis TaxID=32201 RepID=A0A8T1QGK5_CARIL|nr:hypothetical protein CIPAW_05G093000 [Carya illinoinensis]KAG7978467.1 hypothetical protein I3843_05G084600 [Carya illinoinensis]
MANAVCDYRFLLLVAAVAFIYIQVRLFATQSEYADRLAAVVESESDCTSQMRSLIDQISMQQGRIVALWKGLQEFTDKVQVPVAAVVIMACNRADYLERTIKSILKYQSSVALKFPLFVSQDGSAPDVKSKALSYDQLTYMQHLDYKPVQTVRHGELVAYYKIARHYKWALDELFYKHNCSRVIILEDDMEISPDFFDYFEATAALLDKDKSIMAVSSWNDNGQKQFVHDPYALYRSDFFPGLGWMLARSTWDELSPKWPKNHKGRQFIRPEVCRAYGSSMGQFFKNYLEPIEMNDAQFDWKSMDLSYLKEDKFMKHFAHTVKNAKPIQGIDVVLKAYNIDSDVRIQYRDQPDFERIARQFGIFEEWKPLLLIMRLQRCLQSIPTSTANGNYGIPRTAYKGVVVFRYQTSKRIFLVSPDSLKQLGIEGS